MGEVIKALVLSACKLHDHTVTRSVSVTPLYLKRSTQYLAPKPLQGSYWSEHVVQSYGTIERGAVISLERPVLTNQVNPQYWYSAFPGKEPGIIIVPEEIRSVNVTCAPNTLVVAGSSYNHEFPQPLITMLLGTKAAKLGS